MSSWIVALVALLIGAGLGAGTLALLMRLRSVDPPAPVIDRSAGAIPRSLTALLEVLPQSTVLVDSSGLVVQSTAEAQALGVVVGNRIGNSEVARLLSEVARTGISLERDLDLNRSSSGRSPREMRFRVAPLTSDVTLILIEDLSESRRIEAVRRDFVANVSHELKTPVGALGLLAEAVEVASDDPAQVLHFARRMRIESARLAALVADIVDLSRLQGDNPLEHARPVSIDAVIAEAVDSMRMSADASAIDVVRGGTPGLVVFGEESHLLTALRNLIGNAIKYSPQNTRVAVGTRLFDGSVEISVSDQGIGIAVEDQVRIFERFYRVDQARSRDTGGTGLGLAIVKHVCTNHGGSISVWSLSGEGSTFTIRIPAHPTSLSLVPETDESARFTNPLEEGDMHTQSTIEAAS